MRPIKFRGKRLDNGEWVEGDYFRKYIYDRDDDVSLHHLIGWQVADNDGEMCNDYEDVDPATVGQYTGLKDKNGKEIWEGDIVQCKTWQHYVATIIYDDSWGAFSLRFYPFGSGRRVRVTHKSVKVIGNTIDNPELLK